MANVPYGFSALFEAMAIQERRDKTDNDIMNFATGAMESSLLGDDVVYGMGVGDVDTGMEDFEDIADGDMDEDMQMLDSVLDEIADDDDTSGLDELDDALENVIYM